MNTTRGAPNGGSARIFHCGRSFTLVAMSSRTPHDVFPGSAPGHDARPPSARNRPCSVPLVAADMRVHPCKAWMVRSVTLSSRSQSSMHAAACSDMRKP